jgi:hypothetical protein
MALKRNNGKNFAELKSPKVCLANLKYQLKMNTHPWPKTLQKDTVQLSHMSFTTSVT